MNAYTLNGIKDGANNITGITTATLDPGIETFVFGGGGTVDPTTASIMGIKPLISFTTTDLATVLALYGIGGTTAAGMVFSFQALDQAGTRQAVYANITVFAGMVVPRTITGEWAGEINASFDVFCTGDGSNSPIGIDTSAVTHVPGSGETYTLGPIELNGALFEATSVNLDFGIQEILEGNNGKPWHQIAAIGERKPVFNFTTKDMSKMDVLMAESTITDFGLTLTTYEFFFTKKVQGGGGNVPDATEEHVKISGTTGVATSGNAGGAHAASTDLDVKVEPTSDGTNPIVAIDTTSAIA
jgi:hypothetical protein